MFKIDFKLHSIEVTGEDEVTACWTMGMLMPLLPWRPNLMFTGRTFYKVRWGAFIRKWTHVFMSWQKLTPLALDTGLIAFSRLRCITSHLMRV